MRNAIRNKCENQWMDFNDLTEIRLRINCPLIIFIKNNEYVISEYIVNEEDIKTAFNLITEYSAYSFESSIVTDILQFQEDTELDLEDRL